MTNAVSNLSVSQKFGAGMEISPVPENHKIGRGWWPTLSRLLRRCPVQASLGRVFRRPTMLYIFGLPTNFAACPIT
jgi:hypothetical protein